MAADGETNPATLAALADPRLRATAPQLCDAFSACTTLHPTYRRLLKLALDELRLIEDHLGQLDQQMGRSRTPSLRRFYDEGPRLERVVATLDASENCRWTTEFVECGIPCATDGHPRCLPERNIHGAVINVKRCSRYRA